MVSPPEFHPHFNILTNNFTHLKITNTKTSMLKDKSKISFKAVHNIKSPKSSISNFEIHPVQTLSTHLNIHQHLTRITHIEQPKF